MKFIKTLEGQMNGGARLEEMTRQVFAHGLLPNPRQVKRCLNIFNFLRKVAEVQEEEKTIPEEDAIAWPLLAKTVLIQAQWPELYSLWRQMPSLVVSLEGEYEHRPLTEREQLFGQAEEDDREEMREMKGESAQQEKTREALSTRPATGGMLAPFLAERQRYALLMDLLTFPKEPGSGRQRARFSGLKQSQLKTYLGLAGTAGQESLVESSLPDSTEEMLRSGDPAVLREALSRLTETEPDMRGPRHRQAQQVLLQSAQDSARALVERAAAADVLDELGHLPGDLYACVPLPEGEKAQFRIGKYPVTNEQYRRFVESKDFADRQYWLDFPKFSAPDAEGRIEAKGNWGDAGWEWLKENREGEKAILPRYWNDPRFGILRRGVPVVGVTWFEASGFCKWLLVHWDDPQAGEWAAHNPGWKPGEIRLPTEAEWELAAGGAQPKERYPWDLPGQATQDEGEILRRANVGESGIGRTTPVDMYPLGKSVCGVWDLAGNIWEWQANYSDKESNTLALRGGSWYLNLRSACLAERLNFNPDFKWNYYFGFRVCALPG